MVYMIFIMFVFVDNVLHTYILHCNLALNCFIVSMIFNLFCLLALIRSLFRLKRLSWGGGGGGGGGMFIIPALMCNACGICIIYVTNLDPPTLTHAHKHILLLPLSFSISLSHSYTHTHSLTHSLAHREKHSH